MTTPKKRLTAADCRRFAKQIVICNMIAQVAMFGYLAATDNLTIDLMQIPLMALPAAAFCVLLALATARHLDQQ